MRTFAIAAVFVTLAVGGSSAQTGPDGSIELYNVPVTALNTFGDPELGVTHGEVTPFFGGSVAQYAIAIYAILAGATAPGIQGAEFYVDGLERTNTSPPGNDQLPTNWSMAFTPASGLTALTSPVNPHEQRGEIVRRANMFWQVDDFNDPDCQKASMTYFGRIVATNFAGVDHPDDHLVNVVPSDPPSNPTYTAAVLVSCDSPIFTPFNATGGDFTVNRTTAVSKDTWGGVKGLYRR